MSTSQLVGGGFQDSEGNPLAYGNLAAKLNRDAYTDNTFSTFVCAGQTLEYPLDEDGNISGTQYIWTNDQLIDVWNLSADTFYSLSAFSAEGQLAWGPNSLKLDAANSYQFAIQQSFIVPNLVNDSFALTSIPVEDSVSVFVNSFQQSNFTVSTNVVTLGFTPNPGDLVSFTYYTNPTGSTISPTFKQEVPSGSGTAFTLSQTPLANTVELYRGAGPDDGALLQTPGVDYTISGTSITLDVTIGTDTLWCSYQTSETLTTPFEEAPSGAVNSANRTYSLANPATPGSLQMFVNGAYQTPGIDYTLASDNRTITMTWAPSTGSLLRAFYVEALDIVDLTVLSPQNPS